MYGDKMDNMRTRFIGYTYEEARETLYREHREGVTLAPDYQRQLSTLDKMHGHARSDVPKANSTKPVRLNRSLLQNLARSADAINREIEENLDNDARGFVAMERSVYEYNERADVRNLTVSLEEYCDIDGNVTNSNLKVGYEIVVTKVRRHSKVF